MIWEALKFMWLQVVCDEPYEVIHRCSCDDTVMYNTLRSIQNGQNFADKIFKCIFFNENHFNLIKTSLKFVPKGPINN